MKTYTHLTDLPRQIRKTAVALGTFDGIHIGHQKIITAAVELAAKAGSASVVFTFSNHPLTVIDPRRCPPQITTADEKARLIAALNVDILLSIPFTKDFLQLAPREFIALLVKHLRPGHLIVGPNYHYGYKGEGTPENLKAAGEASGFDVFVHPAVYLHSQLVSSTSIRQLIQQGRVNQARHLLGRPPRISGSVIVGDRRGRNLGFPTANIAIDDSLVTPGNGVYAVRSQVAGKHYNGVANIGHNPTFPANTRRIEVFLLDFSGDLYGQNIDVDFLEKLRDEKKFASVDELTAQIAEDIRTAHKYYE
ncbi:MAG: bifunctional riboflavin kinase/FAD synthetase [Negativicutes bacterium]|nr:bifunctional riboflavin kinase/FAD synthetase [Negativicutes bacterium]